MEVILDSAGEYLVYENSDLEHLVSYLISNGDLIYTILIHLALHFKTEKIKPNYIRKL